MTSLVLDPTKKLHKILFFRVVTKCFVRQVVSINGFADQITQFRLGKEFSRIDNPSELIRRVPSKTVLDCFSGLIELPENVCKPKRQGIVLSCWQREQNFWLFIVLYRSAIFRSLPNGRKAAKWKILYLAFFLRKNSDKFAECVLSRAERPEPRLNWSGKLKFPSICALESIGGAWFTSSSRSLGWVVHRESSQFNFALFYRRFCVDCCCARGMNSAARSSEPNQQI